MEGPKFAYRPVFGAIFLLAVILAVVLLWDPDLNTKIVVELIASFGAWGTLAFTTAFGSYSAAQAERAAATAAAVRRDYEDQSRLETHRQELERTAFAVILGESIARHRKALDAQIVALTDVREAGASAHRALTTLIAHQAVKHGQLTIVGLASDAFERLGRFLNVVDKHFAVLGPSGATVAMLREEFTSIFLEMHFNGGTVALSPNTLARFEGLPARLANLANDIMVLVNVDVASRARQELAGG